MPVTNYYSANGVIIAEHTTGQSRLDYVTDALGSVIATVDQTLTVQSTARYKPYGADLVTVGTQTRLGFVGSQGYRRTGLPHSDIYAEMRHDSTVEGRWTTLDPLWPWEGAFLYCKSNPASIIDPSGLGSIIGGNGGNGRGGGSSGWPAPLPPDKPCSLSSCGATSNTINIRYGAGETTVVNEIKLSAAPFGVGLEWKTNVFLTKKEAVWTVAHFTCVCFNICGDKYALWKPFGVDHCRGGVKKVWFMLLNVEVDLSIETYSDGSPGCPRYDLVSSFKGNVYCYICQSLNWPHSICEKFGCP
jgi:RHS repeat-associated protein